MPKPVRKMHKTNAAAQAAVLPRIPPELLDQLVKGPMTAEAVEDASLAFKKALIERALGAEMSYHLGYATGADKPEAATNHRNGKSGKTVLTDDGPVRIEVPRDRAGEFEPRLIGKRERRFTGFDDKIIAMYARGMTVREIQGFLAEMYATEVAPDFISGVTDAVLSEITAWQSRPLEPMYPVIFFDALRVKIREDNVVRNKAVYLALGVRPDGSREILGLWIENTEGAKFWMKVFNDLKTRGVEDILIAVTDGLKGMAEALAVVYPATTLQTCIVHLIRNSLEYASWKDRRGLAAAIKPIYTAAQCRSGRSRTGGLRGRALGAEISHRGGILAAGLVERNSVLRVSAAGAPSHLHHQRDRERERPAAQDHQDARPFPFRRGRSEADLAGAAQHHRRLEPWGTRLEGGDEPIRDSLSRPFHAAKSVRCLSTDFPTASVVRRKRRPPPWKSLQRLTHRIQDTFLFSQCSSSPSREPLAITPLLRLDGEILTGKSRNANTRTPT